MSLVNAKQIIDSITSALFTAEERRLSQVIENINKQNREASTVPTDGFMYNGNYYRPASLPNGKYLKQQLHFSLEDDMDKFLADKKTVDDDRKMISQMLFKLINTCETFQELRDTLPNCLQDTVPEIKHISRVNEEAYQIINDGRAYSQYLKILPRIQFYAIARLLY